MMEGQVDEGGVEVKARSGKVVFVEPNVWSCKINW